MQAKNTRPVKVMDIAAPAKKRVQKNHHVFNLHDKQRQLLIAATLSIVLLGIISLAVLKQHNNAAPDNVATVTRLVAKHMVLPKNEEPALATVTDAKKLSTPFLKQAQDGDRILIYQKNQLAIIYRPTIDRIIAVGPVSIDTPATKATGDNGTDGIGSPAQ